MSEWKDDAGVSFYVCIGPWEGFGIHREPGLRYGVVLGCVSVTIMLRDVERFVGSVMGKFEEFAGKGLLDTRIIEHGCGGTWVMRECDGWPQRCVHCGEKMAPLGEVVEGG